MRPISIGKLILLPIMFFSSKVDGKDKVPQVGDVYELAEEVGWYLAVEHKSALEWISFDSKSEGKIVYGKGDADFYPKQYKERCREKCKLIIHEDKENFFVNNAPKKRETEESLYHEVHINDKSTPNELVLSKELGYKDINIYVTKQGFKRGSSVDARLGFELPLASGSVSINEHFEWDTSTTRSEYKEEKRNEGIIHNFKLPPFSKTEVNISVKKLNYEVDFGTSFLIEGKVTYWFKDDIEIYDWKRDEEKPKLFFPDIGTIIKSALNSNSSYLKRIAGYYKNQVDDDGDLAVSYNVIGKLSGEKGYDVFTNSTSVPLGDNDNELKKTKTLQIQY